MIAPGWVPWAGDPDNIEELRAARLAAHVEPSYARVKPFRWELHHVDAGGIYEPLLKYRGRADSRDAAKLAAQAALRSIAEDLLAAIGEADATAGARNLGSRRIAWYDAALTEAIGAIDATQPSLLELLKLLYKEGALSDGDMAIATAAAAEVADRVAKLRAREGCP